MNGRVLVCSYYPPEPERDSGSRRLLDMMDLLADEGCAVTFLAANGLPDRRQARLLEQRGVPVFDATSSNVEQLLSDGDFDIALIAFWQIAERYLPLLRRLSPTTRVVVDSVDLQFVREARRIVGPDSGRALLHAGYAEELVGELNVYAAADVVLTVSSVEAQIIATLLGVGYLVRSVPDIEELERSTTPFEQRKGVVFIGSFRHPPNVDALNYLCDEIIPLIDPEVLAEHPVTIVGDGLTDLVRDRTRRRSDVHLVGWVPSVLPYLERARISVVPLRYGAGTKRKMIQALGVGTPTVSSSVGTEGLDLEPGEHVLVADEADQFATAVNRLVTDAVLWQRLSDEGHDHIGKLHKRSAVRARLASALHDSDLRPPKPAVLPEVDEAHYSRRVQYQHKQRLLPIMQGIVRDRVPTGAVIAVVSEGDDELLALGTSVTCWHYPQSPLGGPTETHPASDADAIDQLEELRQKGAEYVLVPATSSWWFDHYADWSTYLHFRHELVIHYDGVMTLFGFRKTEPNSASPEQLVDVAGGAPTPHVGVGARGTGRHAEHAPTAQMKQRAPDTGDVHATRLIAFYLPQFHPIAENDEWWGDGFTEWTNVAAATPLFPGHLQPHLPADLGFYDLRLAEAREHQAALARRYGISAFCYYHYWFHGKRLLERPFEEMLGSGRPDLQFCLCWANEPWSRRWDGQPHDVLQPQHYSADDDLAHIRALMPAFRDPRALTVDGKPIFIVYQARDLPDPRRTVDLWREEVDKAGLPDLYLMTVETGWDAGWDATEVGFDAKVLFQPHFTTLFGLPRMAGTENSSLRVYDYQEASRVLADPEPVAYPRFDTVFPRWDNTPRRGLEGVVLHDSTPEAYQRWLEHAIDRVRDRPPEERVVFINAWNEWGEGCYLEPDRDHGLAYLEATAQALAQRPAASAKGAVV